MSGTLYGIGLGPGDPELMTLKAHRLIANARIIAYPAPLDGVSFARSIAANAIRPGTRELVLELPMRVARDPAQAAYDKAAQQIAACLADGHDVAVLCEGDPLFYGSFMYLHARLESRFACEIVPGVSSIMASSAALKRPLAARSETLVVIPGPLNVEDMRRQIASADAVVIMKVGRHIAKIRRLFQALGLTDYAVYIERATLPEQRMMPLAEAPDDAPYFSMILMTKGADPWL